ncbi:MAG: hypothetical protein ACXAC5_07810 [Promethearchaeota archaeon]
MTIAIPILVEIMRDDPRRYIAPIKKVPNPTRIKIRAIDTVLLVWVYEGFTRHILGTSRGEGFPPFSSITISRVLPRG